MIYAKDNLDSLNTTFNEYWTMTKKSRPQALSKAARTFSFSLRRRLKERTAKMGAITSERLSVIKQKGIHISNRAYATLGVSTNASTSLRSGSKNGAKGIGGFALQRLLVAKELQYREANRAFTEASSFFKGALDAETLAKAGASVVGSAKPIKGGTDEDSFQFNWGSQVSRWSAVAAVGLNKPTRRDVFDPALIDTRNDMRVYIERKQKENARAAARFIKSL